MPQRRPYNRWKPSEKERLIALRQQNPDMSYTKLANVRLYSHFVLSRKVLTSLTDILSRPRPTSTEKGYQC